MLHRYRPGVIKESMRGPNGIWRYLFPCHLLKIFPVNFITLFFYFLISNHFLISYQKYSSGSLS